MLTNIYQISPIVLHNLASQVNVSCFKVCYDIFTEKQDKWMINKMIDLSVKTLYHEESSQAYFFKWKAVGVEQLFSLI